MIALTLVLASPVFGADGGQTWSREVSGSFYLAPDQEDFLQPTLRADRGRLHLEARYNYEDRHSTSGFVGANFEMGDEVTLTVTPMIGALVGRTDGIVPAVELAFGWRKLEAYGEAEVVIDLGEDAQDYFYMWSELSLWATGWLRAGGVGQRTRVNHSERDIQPGVLAGTRLGNVDGTVYLFSPGSEDRVTVLILSVGF